MFNLAAALQLDDVIQAQIGAHEARLREEIRELVLPERSAAALPAHPNLTKERALRGRS